MRQPQYFPFRFAAAYRLPALLFGITSTTTGVWVDETMLRIRFGPWRLHTPLTNVISTTHTGPYPMIKTVGPAHLSLADRGLTYATNNERGLCIRFRQPVAGIEPLGLLRHPAITVTVADCHGLARALNPSSLGRLLHRRHRHHKNSPDQIRAIFGRN
jgi:hypothetical protein